MSIIKSLPTKKIEFFQGSELIMRLGIGMTLFFPRPFKDVREEILDLWHKYIVFVGKENLSWARLGGGNRSRVVNASTFRTIEAWLTGKKDYGANCWISIHNGPMDCLDQYGFQLQGLGKPAEDEEDVGFVDVSLPIELIDSIGVSAINTFFLSLAEKIPFYCGMAGYIFHRSPYKYDATIGKMAALSRRFEGVEIRASHRECYWAAKGIVSVNWLTFVGNDFVGQMGGYKKLINKLPAECLVNSFDHGISICAGDAPLLGDKNSGKDELNVLRKIYKVLKPIQFVDTIYELDPFDFDGDRTAEWLQRLDL